MLLVKIRVLNFVKLPTTKQSNSETCGAASCIEPDAEIIEAEIIEASNQYAIFS